MSEYLRCIARKIFEEAMGATTVAAAVKREISVRDRVLTAGGCTYDLASFSAITIISIGKAGATLFDAVRVLLPADVRVSAVISAPSAPQYMSERDRWFAGGHPLPNQASLHAAHAALALLDEADAHTLVLFLISGGASAMFEAPLSPDVTLADMLALNRWLIGSGAPICDINCVRKHLSAVKGGRLAVRAGEATKLTLLISDVPEGALDALGSGPTLPDETTCAMAKEVVETQPDGDASLPARYAKTLSDMRETPKADDPAFANAEAVVLLDNAQLMASAKESAERHGFHVVIDNRCDDWDYAAAADYLLERFRSLAAEHPRVCLLSGGEVTVKLPEAPGRGGRNQQWALYCAMRLAASGRVASLLSAGSDGIDGHSPAAGCVADESTVERGLRCGLDAAKFLAGFDAFPFFDGLADCIVTGPSGNNLRDIRMLLAE